MGNKKNRSKKAACKQKITREKRILVHRPTSLYFIRLKEFNAAKPRAFALHFLFRRDQKHENCDSCNTKNEINRSSKIKTTGAVLKNTS